MPELAREPSMEDILASIKRLIADDGAAATAASVTRLRRGPVEVPRADPDEDDETVLELTETVAPVAAPPPPVERAPEPELEPPPLVSEQAASASRQSLAALSAMLVGPGAGRDNTLEGLVREMLRPMLKDWLDAKLPELVEAMVAGEIARIAGRAQ